MRIACLLLWSCLAAFALVACSDPSHDVGVVARVNGKPLYLSQLEFQHDLLHMDGAGSFVPTVETLRREYGEILGNLIVLELVSQDLDKRGLGVTDEEVAAEERKIRQDYPGDSFDQVLVEEYIDLASWRQQLRYGKALQKFQRLVLRPRVKVDYREAESYYKEHLQDFEVPETLRALVVRSPARASLTRALDIYKSSHDPEAMQKDGQVSVHEITVRPPQLSPTWLESLRDLPVGDAGPVMEEKFGYEALVLLERAPARQLTPTQAYPLVEQALLERKLNVAFDDWLATAWKSADVSVSRHLLPQAEKDAPAAEAPAAAEGGEAVSAPDGQAPAEDLNAREGEQAPLGPDDDQPRGQDGGADAPAKAQ